MHLVVMSQQSGPDFTLVLAHFYIDVPNVDSRAQLCIKRHVNVEDSTWPLRSIQLLMTNDETMGHR